MPDLQHHECLRMTDTPATAATAELTRERWLKPEVQSVPLSGALAGAFNFAADDGTIYLS